jgi:CheY-like chemotaxis protein
MRTVLVVDDEPSVLFALSEGLADKRRGLQVITAENGRDAVDLLESKRVDLVLTDLRMPEMDGFELLTHLRRNFANLPVILMTALGSTEMAARLGTEGSFECFTKPFDVAALKRKITEMLAASVKGRVENISLASFLQLLEMERKTCTLHVSSIGRKGDLFFRTGRLIDAETGELRGQEAALEIVTWEHAEIEISDVCPPGEPVIERALHFLLMEGMRLKDEAEGTAAPPAVDQEPDEVLAAQISAAPSRAKPDLAERIGESLKKARVIKGATALLLAETATGSVLAATGDAEGVELGSAAAMAFGQLLRQKQRIDEQLSLSDPLQEILISSADRYQLVRPLGVGEGYFLLLILDRQRANLGRAQLDLVAIERDLLERVSS